jgi:hypothetical protein
VPTPFRPALPLLLAGLALSLAACQDPSGVGLTLIGDETSDPNARLFPADSVYLEERVEPTGGFANGTGSPPQTNVLLGSAQDPLLGDVRATAYIDVRAANRPTDFDERDIDQVQILLDRGFVYGDTLASLPVEVREITASPGWTPEGLPADTTLATGDLLTSATVSVQDTLTTIALPQDYVDARGEVLRDSVNTLFEGFQLRVPEGMGPMPGAVLGIFAGTSSDSAVRLITDAYVNDDGETTRDTVDYPLVEVYSAVARGEAAPPPDRVLLRDGTSDALGLRFDVGALANLPLANAGLRIPIDRSVLETNDGFNRPLVGSYVVFGVRADSTREVLVRRAVPEADDERPDELIIRDGALTNAYQAFLLGLADIVALEIAPEPTPLTLGTLPVIVEDDLPSELRRPRLSLIVVGGPPS